MTLNVVKIIVFRCTVINNMGWKCIPATACAWICPSPRSLRCTIRFLIPAKSAETTQASVQPPLIIAHFAIYSRTPRWLTFASKSHWPCGLFYRLQTEQKISQGHWMNMYFMFPHLVLKIQKSPSTPKFRFLSGLNWMGLLEEYVATRRRFEKPLFWIFTMTL